jgi:hypothetical protein
MTPNTTTARLSSRIARHIAARLNIRIWCSFIVDLG